MPRALWLFEYPTMNGGEHSLLSAAPALLDDGWEIVAAAPSRGPLSQRLDELGVRRVDLPLHRDARRVEISQARQLIHDCIVDARPALVHANSLAMARLVGPVVSDLPPASLGHIRDIVGLSREAVRDVNRVDRLLAVSDATRRWHVRQGVEPERLRVCFNGVDLDYFKPPATRGQLDDLRAELGVGARPVLLSVGQLGARKGCDVLLEAAVRLPAPAAGFQVLIVGERNSRKDEAIVYEDRLRRLADSPPLAGRVHLLGRRKDVRDLLQLASIVVHAARQEPLGRVLLEAAACGRPIVATDVGGSEEIFPVGRGCARLVRPDDPAALARALRQLLSDDAQRRLLGRRARRRAEEAFDARRAGAALAQHYAACVAAPAR